MKEFKDAIERNFKKLELYVPVVERVHGENHPEFYGVRKLYDEIVEKIKDLGIDKPELDREFKDLKEITNNYRVPGDVCESYQAVYNMLEELDKAYYGQ